MADSTKVDGICAFCNQYGRLHESHVIPAFIFRWLRGRSGTGHIRHTDAPNRRVQDGLKFHWLCGACEADFSKYETAFATKLFHPWLSGNHNVAYTDWLLKFCVSVSWRVLKFARGKNPEADYKVEQTSLADDAEARWRAFLEGEVPHPGPFEQHLLILDNIEETTVPKLPENINRFIMGAVTLDIVGSERSLMTFAKLGPFLIFGMIQKGTGKWEGTKVHVKQGFLNNSDKTVPGGLLPLLREKAELAGRGLEAMSPAQRNKVDQQVLNNLDSFAASGQFRSILADARLFGEQAILRKKPR